MIFDSENKDSQSLPEDLKAALNAAAVLRVEGGMVRIRIFLLHACWRHRVPWLPDQLCPSAMPPDFRMHYGSEAKRMLLDSLIQRGQHDVVSSIVAETSGSDAFVP